MAFAWMTLGLPVQAQTAADYNEGLLVTAGTQAGEFTLSWWGKAGRTYFIQQSFDLMTWQYVPVVLSGAADVCGMNFTCSDFRQFWRLRYTDQTYTGDVQDADFDGDGASNQVELNLSLDPFDSDTDDDGLTDGEELDVYFTNALIADSDGDGLNDGMEVLIYLTDPWDRDTDDDTLEDGDEVNVWNTDPLAADSDGDGLDDAQEALVHQTNPNQADSDNDGISDGSEIMQGKNANDAASRPAFESLKVVGNGEQGERKTKSITITLPEGRADYMLLIATNSMEYPQFTGETSEYNDEVDWKVTPQGGDVLEGSAEVNDLHSQWEASEENETSLLDLTPVAVLKMGVVKGREGETTTVEIELGAKNVRDAVLPTTIAAAVVPVAVEADTGMAGVIGDTVKSAKPESTVKHFVTPKANGPAEGPPEPIDQPYVILKAVGFTAEQITDDDPKQIVKWEGGEPVEGEPLKRKVPRSSTGTGPVEVKIKTKTDDELLTQTDVWVVWCDPPVVTNGTASFGQVTKPLYVGGTFVTDVNVGAGYTSATNWRFTFAIRPFSICNVNVLERPELTKPKQNPVPGAGNDYSFNPSKKADHAALKWDVSRQIKVTIRNPNSISKSALENAENVKLQAAFCVNQPTANDSPVTFPSNPVEGNDDPDLSPIMDEDANPYEPVTSGDLQHAAGELVSVDAPNAYANKSWGGVNYHFGVEYNFREFCRLEITDGARATGTFWFKISDYFEWHYYFSTDFDDNSQEWHDAQSPGSSNTDTGHPIP